MSEIFPESPLPMPLGAERLSEIRDRERAASKGPWWTDTLAESDGSESIGIDAGDDHWIVPCQDLDPADAEFMAHARVDVPALLADNDLLRAQVAELNEALSTAAEALRARQSCPCPPADQPGPHQVGCFFDGVPVSPPSERPVDGPSPLFPTVASLRELSSREEPHDSPLHQAHRIPHDMPEGCRLTAEQVQELGNPFLGGGAS